MGWTSESMEPGSWVQRTLDSTPQVGVGVEQVDSNPTTVTCFQIRAKYCRRRSQKLLFNNM